MQLFLLLLDDAHKQHLPKVSRFIMHTYSFQCIYFTTFPVCKHHTGENIVTVVCGMETGQGSNEAICVMYLLWIHIKTFAIVMSIIHLRDVQIWVFYVLCQR